MKPLLFGLQLMEDYQEGRLGERSNQLYLVRWIGSKRQGKRQMMKPTDEKRLLRSLHLKKKTANESTPYGLMMFVRSQKKKKGTLPAKQNVQNIQTICATCEQTADNAILGNAECKQLPGDFPIFKFVFRTVIVYVVTLPVGRRTILPCEQERPATECNGDNLN